MSLNNLEKRIYDPDSGIEKREHEKSGFNPVVSFSKDARKLQEEKKWNGSVKAEDSSKFKAFKIGAIAFGSIVLLAGFLVIFIKFRQSAFKESNVSVKIEGLANVNSSQETKYKIIFKNSNRTKLKNAKILLSYPENFRPKESQYLKIENPYNSQIFLGDVRAYSRGEFEISGEFFAAEDTVVYLKAVMEYVPSNLSSTFQSKNQLGVNVNLSPLVLDIQAPIEVAEGNKVDYVIEYQNLSSRYFKEIRLKIDYPNGFSFISSDLAPSENDNVWYLGNVNPSSKGKITISGNIESVGEENKTISAYIGYLGENGEFIIYDKEEKLTKMTSSILAIKQSIQNKSDFNVNAGEELNYLIEYNNKGDISLKDAVVTIEIESRILNFSKLQLKNGFFNSGSKTITWRASEISELANLNPGDKGQISFTVPVLEKIPVENSNDNNFTILSRAKIDSPSIPTPIGSNKIIASDIMELKLNSKVVLDVKGYYKDANLENYGPFPPKVDQETSYVIHWKIFNVSNDINNVKVVSSLPSGVKWAGKTFPDNETVNFNERTNQLEWEVGKLDSGSGIINPAKEVSFQVSVIPQIYQVGKEIILINESILTAKDLFTDSDIKITMEKKTSRILEDSEAGTGYQVIN